MPDVIPSGSITGAEVRLLRRAVGTTREQLADLLGVPARTVERWEVDDAPVPPRIADQLEQLVDEVHDRAEDLAGRLLDMAEPVLLIPREGESLEGVGSGMWLVLAAIVVPMVPGLRVAHAETAPADEVVQVRGR